MNDTVKKKIYCFNNGGSKGWEHAVAICEDGRVLARHLCSSEAYMSHDLGITSNWQHESYNAHCGVGRWELVWVPTEDVATHPGLLAAMSANCQMNFPGEYSGELRRGKGLAN